MTYGLCECGCEKETPLCKYTLRNRGFIKGMPLRFIPGHQNKNRKWSESSVSKRAKAMMGHIVTTETRNKISINHKIKGVKQSKEAIRLSNLNRGIRENHPSWKGGITYVNGYKCIYNPNHHRSMPNGYVYEHIIIIETILERKLLPKEVIHHIDGIKLNNAPSNLMVVSSQSEHINIHRKQGDIY